MDYNGKMLAKQIERLLDVRGWEYEEDVLRDLSSDDVDRCPEELTDRSSSGAFEKDEAAFHERKASP